MCKSKKLIFYRLFSAGQPGRPQVQGREQRASPGPITLTTCLPPVPGVGHYATFSHTTRAHTGRKWTGRLRCIIDRVLGGRAGRPALGHSRHMHPPPPPFLLVLPLQDHPRSVPSLCQTAAPRPCCYGKTRPTMECLQRATHGLPWNVYNVRHKACHRMPTTCDTRPAMECVQRATQGLPWNAYNMRHTACHGMCTTCDTMPAMECLQRATQGLP